MSRTSRYAILAAASLLAGGGLMQAQEFTVTPPRERPVTPVAPTDVRPSIEGIVKDIFVTKRPWQLVNPAAPKSYGTGEKNVSKDFGPGTPHKSTGLIVAGVEW